MKKGYVLKFNSDYHVDNPGTYYGDGAQLWVAVVGSRNYKNLARVRQDVSDLIVDWRNSGSKRELVIVSGHAPGVDMVAEEAARELGCKTAIFPAGTKPKARNRKIAQCNHMLAYWDGRSGGTANAIAWANHFDAYVTVILDGEDE